MDKEKSMENSMSSIRDLLQIAPLLLSIEKQVISILIVKGLVKVINPQNNADDYVFSNVELTERGEQLIEDDEELSEVRDLLWIIESTAKREKLTKVVLTTISDEDIERYRNVFPSGSRGPGKKIVRAKLERFLSENECTLDEIIEAAKLYIRHNSSKGYNIAGAHYFISKRDITSRIDESKCEEFLEQVRMGNHVVKDWRDETV